MPTKHYIAGIVDGRLVLPDEAIASLPRGPLLRVVVDEADGTVCIHAVPPPEAPIGNREIMEALWARSAQIPDEEYFAPMTEETLRGLKETRRRLQREAGERAAARGDGGEPEA